MITATMNVERVNGRIAELYDALIASGQNSRAAHLIEDTCRRFLKRVIGLTAPKSLKQGQAAVERDLKKIFTPVDAGLMEEIASRHGMSDVIGWFEKSNHQPQQVQWDKIDPSGDGMDAYHWQNVDRRGRATNRKRLRSTSGWYAPYVVTKEVFGDYLAKMKSHVGRKKAAWAVSALAMGMKVASWIRTQIPSAKGSCDNRLNVPGKPSVTLASMAPGVSEDTRQIQSALRYEYNALGREARNLRDGIIGDWKSGLKFARKASNTGAQFDTVE